MKIFCIGRNYIGHAKELNNPVPKQPLVFIKPKTALLQNDSPFYHPEFSEEIHYECELVFKMEKNGKHIKEKYVPGYLKYVTLGIDFTARDVQRKCKEKGHPWEKAKAFDHSAPIGELIDLNTLPHHSHLKFELKKNGEVVQSGNTKDLIFPLETLIEHISSYFTVNRGDLIFTGTPAGVGQVKIGDHLEGFLEGKKILDCTIM